MPNRYEDEDPAYHQVLSKEELYALANEYDAGFTAGYQQAIQDVQYGKLNIKYKSTFNPPA